MDDVEDLGKDIQEQVGNLRQNKKQRKHHRRHKEDGEDGAEPTMKAMQEQEAAAFQEKT